MGAREADLDVAVERAQAGDARGFDELFRAFSPSVVGYLRARDVSDPDGLANEVFLRVFRTLHTFQGDGARFRSWLFTIVHHAAMDDARRRRRRVAETPLEQAPEIGRGEVEDEVIGHMADLEVDTLLRRLSPDQREVLMLRVVADLSIEQTAAVMDKSYEAVKALQHRGLVALRCLLADHEAAPK